MVKRHKDKKNRLCTTSVNTLAERGGGAGVCGWLETVVYGIVIFYLIVSLETFALLHAGTWASRLPGETLSVLEKQNWPLCLTVWPRGAVYLWKQTNWEGFAHTWVRLE
jgi:hypothetical protein